jgi:hypothetical protein
MMTTTNRAIDVFRDKVKALEEHIASAEAAEYAAFLAGWQAMLRTDSEIDTMGFAPQTPEEAYAEWKDKKR